VGAGTPITFTAPSSGASLSAPSFTALTDANGVVTASVSANGIAGTYTVTATAPHTAGAAAFTLVQTARPYTIFIPTLIRSARP
jgi:hypothetical protein